MNRKLGRIDTLRTSLNLNMSLLSIAEICCLVQGILRMLVSAKLILHFYFRVPRPQTHSLSQHLSPSSVWLKRGMGMAADPDANMLSSMSSLKAQLLPRLSIGNCCSNFHTLLNDFLLEGCGAASENTFTCLQEYNGDPLLRVCCSWHKECRASKKAKHAAWLANATNLQL